MNLQTLIRMAAIAALVVAALVTPGFLSSTSLLSLLTTMSFVGCVAIGMGFITLSGNIMSFALGATLEATTVVFMSSLTLGLLPALALAFLFAIALTGIQGCAVGYFRANPIIVSMAAMALIYGVATYITEGRGVYPEGNETDILTGRIGPLPIPLIAFLASVALAQFLITSTRFGRHLIMVGSNPRVAEAAGIETGRTIALAYVTAGAFTALAAVLMAARYASGDMTQGAGLDYDAIGIVLVGGNAIAGGEGSALRVFAGAIIVSTIQGLLLLWGFSTPMQFLTIGIVVLGVILLQTRGRAR